MERKQHGFTLIELAVVLVIIGLIVGSVLAIQSIVRVSQLHKMLEEYNANVEALKEFQDKFLALPGDMKGIAGYTPEDMWGQDASCPNTPSTTVAHIATCNGDGLGTIGNSDASGSTEWFRAWQQLSDAGFIPGSFTGTPGSGGGQEARPGQNVPASAVSGAGWTLYYYSQIADGPNLWGDQYGHIMVLGEFTPGGITMSPALTAVEALSIDQKIDDGNPGLGIVRAFRNTGCTTDTGSQASQVYNTNGGSTVPACSLIFLTRF